MSADFQVYPSWGRWVIECITPRAETFFEGYCLQHTPCPLEDVPANVYGRRRFEDDLDSDGAYVDAAVAAAEAAGLVDEAG